MVNGQKKFTPSPLTLSEKLEFLYLSPYYLQAFFFLIGTFSWLISETIFAARLPFWTSLWGWSLVLTNMLALPLMNAVGLFLEESEERDYFGIASFAALTYIVVPFQAYASIKGFIQKEEGPWFRTPKTGRITDIFARGRFYRFISGILPGRTPAVVQSRISNQFSIFKQLTNNQPPTTNHYLALASANNQFDQFNIRKRGRKWVGKVAVCIVLLISILLTSLSPFVSASSLAQTVSLTYQPEKAEASRGMIEVPEAEELSFKNEKVKFSFTDENAEESLIVKADQKTYLGLTRAEVYFSVTNIGNQEEMVNFQFHFPQNLGEVERIEKWQENASDQNNWQNIDLLSSPLAVKQRKPIPGNFKIKKSTEVNNKIEPGQTDYFRMEINFPIDSSGEFYIEAIGDKSGYGLLDPWWSSSWNYRKSITIDNDKVGIISDMGSDAASGQKDITVKTGSLFAANEYVVIKDDSHEETGQVDSVSTNTITLKANLTYSYTTAGNGFVKNTTDSTAMTDFPILVNLASDSDLAADALDNGDDIAFADNASPQVQLNHEIENFNGTTGELQAWVQIPTLSASSDTIIYLYYGNSGASNQEDVSGTWDSNYSIVWHLKDLTTSTVKDSTTASSNNGNKKAANEPVEIAGQIATAQDHAGDNDYILSSGAFWSAPSNWTADVWFKADSTSGVVVDWLGQATINTGYHDSGIELVNGTVYIRFWNLACTSIGTVTTGTWNHAVVRYSGTSLTGFLNGVQGNTTNGSLSPNGTMYVSLGATDSTNCGSGAYFDGIIDEFRWSNSARGVDWIKTSEKNQRFPSTFYTLGSEELVPETVVSAYGTQTSSLGVPITNQSIGGSFVIQSTSGSRDVTGIVITENGTVNAQNNLSNVKLYYENDTSAPYNCVSESYGGGESQFGSTTSFNGTDGTASFSGTTVGISTISAMCVYTVLDVGSGAGNNETLEIKINNPSTDVTLSAGSVNTDVVEISGTTTLLTPADLTQIHYRWRNDDNPEMGNNPLWGDANYAYRKKITITGQSGAGTSYQVKLLVGESSGSSGANFNLGGHILSSFNDLRFTDNDGSTLLDYWIQETSGITPNQTATVWVEVTDDLGSNTDIFAYYGYSSATAYSNGNNTFIFFDDFNDGSIDTNKWTKGGNMTESSGYATGATSGTDYLFGKTRINIDTSTVIRIQNKSTAGIARPGVLQSNGNPYSIVGFGWQDYSNNYRYTDTYDTGVTQVQRNQFTTNWYYLETAWQTSSVKFWVDGSLLGTHTTQIPISSRVLYGQVEGNANYDYFFTRKYITTEPAFSSADTEEAPIAGATFAAAEDTELTDLEKETLYRVRFEVSNEGGQSSGGVTYQLQVAETDTCSSGSYAAVPTDASGDWQIVGSTYITDGQATQNVSGGLTDEATTFIAGELKDTGNTTGSITLDSDEFTEIEYAVYATANATNDGNYCFRLYDTHAGSVLDAYSSYAEAVIVPELAWIFFGLGPFIPLIIRRKRKVKVNL